MTRLAPPTSPRIAGVLLAGGRSSRFGAEKAVALFGGKPLMDTVVSAFAELPRFAVSAKPASAAAARARDWGVVVLHDDASAPEGPLAGIAAGLDWGKREKFDFIATAPCDAPLLPAELFRRLAEGVGAAPAAYAVTDEGEHPLCALWRIELCEQVKARLAAGEHPAARAFLEEVGAARIHFDDARAFANANTAGALSALGRNA
jgi:molybdopterin-guanine dinucleotide biosynthesis protein A